MIQFGLIAESIVFFNNDLDIIKAMLQPTSVQNNTKNKATKKPPTAPINELQTIPIVRINNDVGIIIVIPTIYANIIRAIPPSGLSSIQLKNSLKIL